jgi:hypothetical protein
VKLFVDLSTMSLIEGPGLRSSVSAVRFKRGDSPTLVVVFLENGITPVAIGDQGNLVLEFGVKAKGAYDQGYLVHLTDWTLQEADSASPSYVGTPSFESLQLNEALGVGSPPELASVTLMGELTWRDEQEGPWTSTRTFAVVVENDVNRGGENDPIIPETPLTNSTSNSPNAIAKSGPELFVFWAGDIGDGQELHRLFQTEDMSDGKPIWSTDAENSTPTPGARCVYAADSDWWIVQTWDAVAENFTDLDRSSDGPANPYEATGWESEFGVFSVGYSLHNLLTDRLSNGPRIAAVTNRPDGIPDRVAASGTLAISDDIVFPASNPTIAPQETGGVSYGEIKEDFGLTPASIVSLGGIKFPSVFVPSANVNTLDEYREGAFQCFPVCATTPGSYVLNLSLANYTRVGNWVHFCNAFSISSVALAGSGQVRLQLPFQPTVGTFMQCVRWSGVAGGSVINIFAELTSGSTWMTLFRQTAAAASTVTEQFTASHLQAGTRLEFNGSYRC